MSKNTTKKGLALGAGIALVASAFVAAPASADTTGPITLVPTQGTTFNSILQSGITLMSEIDPNTAEVPADLTYIVTNPGLAKISLQYKGDTGSGVNQVVDTNATAYANAGSSGLAMGTGAAIAANATNLVNPFIYVAGATSNVAGASATLAITSSETTKNVTVTVQAFLDADDDGFMDTFESRSDAETIVLYAASNVSATTSIDYIARDNAFPRVSVVYNNNINPWMVQAKTSVKLFNNGSLVDLSNTRIANGADDNTTDSMSVGLSATTVAADLTNATEASRKTGITKNVLTAGAANNGASNRFFYVADDSPIADQGDTAHFSAGVYTAQAYYAATSTVAVGAASRAVDLSNGSNADVDTLDATVTSTASLGFTAGSNALAVKTGTTSFVANVQAEDNNVTLKKSNIKVRATVTAVTLDSGAVSVSGSSASLVEDGVTVAYGFTNSSGVASFTITNTGATDTDVVTAAFEVLKADGTWAASETITATWADAALESWESVGGNYVSGASVSVTFSAEDQFGAPISTDGTSALSVVATAYVGGIAKATTYSKTVSVVDGEATFTFDNFAAAGGSAQLQATLNAGTSAATLGDSGSSTITVNVYNTNATSSVTVADSFETAISYTDFATGKVSALTTAPIASETVFATITGNVLNVNGVGQPGVAVTLSADGVLFKDASVYAEDTITTYANEYGAISVDVYSHAVNTAGATVSITADGVTTSTLLKTKLPTSLADENLAFSWNLPAEIVKNTTYAVVATLTDKWGNPVKASDAQGNADATDYAVAFQGTGSIEINGVGTTVYKDFNSKGEVTVFVRSIKDIAGPGAVSATLGTAWIYPTTLVGGTSAAGSIGSSNTVDDPDTVWDETLWASTLSAERDVKDVASVVAGDTKVNAGSFKGYVAVYAKGYKGQRLSAKVGKDWVIVPALASDFVRVVEFTGAGVDVAVRIYIDRVLVDTINLTTK